LGYHIKEKENSIYYYMQYI